MTQPRSRVDLYAAIRRDARSGMSNRALQRKHGVGFRTVTAALESAWPKERKQPPKRGSRLDVYRVVIDELAALGPRRAAEAATHGEADLRPAA